MGRFFIPRQWRFPRVVYFWMIAEFPFTVANLALFGIASPNLYRTILWAEGGRRGFNSDPTTTLYAAANYRPVKTPVVWSSFNTQYNLYIGVVCMFFYLIKVTAWLLHVFFPIFSLPLHIGLAALWAVSIHVQTAKDDIDPKRVNNGAPWYLTKNCDIVEDKTVRGYCMMAKASFAVSVLMLIIYIAHIILALYSLYPTEAARLAHAEKQAEKRAFKEKYQTSPIDSEMSPEQQWQHMWELQQLPRTPGTATTFGANGWGGRPPVTPRTQAFGKLEGARHETRYVSPVKEEEEWHREVVEQKEGAEQQGQGLGLGTPQGAGAGAGQQQYWPSPVEGQPGVQLEWGYDGKGKGTAV